MEAETVEEGSLLARSPAPLASFSLLFFIYEAQATRLGQLPILGWVLPCKVISQNNSSDMATGQAG